MAEAQHGNISREKPQLHTSASTDITKNARALTPLAPRPCPCPSVSTACTGIPAWCTPVVDLDKLVLITFFSFHFLIYSSLSLLLSSAFTFLFTHFLPVPLTFSFDLLQLRTTYLQLRLVTSYAVRFLHAVNSVCDHDMSRKILKPCIE